MVGIITTHPSIDDIAASSIFFKLIFKYLKSSGYDHYKEFNYALINGLELKEAISDEF
jgi:hypothetical protein